jgi:hypothetical protein
MALAFAHPHAQPMLATVRREPSKEDARLSVLEYEQHGGHRTAAPRATYPSDACVAGKLQRAGERIRHRKLLIRHHAGENRTDDDVDDRADGKPTEDAERQVALRIACLSAAVEIASKPM